MHAIQFAGLRAGTQHPPGHGVILAPITPIRTEIFMLQTDQVEMIKKAGARDIGTCERRQSCMARGAEIIALRVGHGPGDDNLQVHGGLIGRRRLTHPDMILPRPMAGFAIDARLRPGRVVRIPGLIIAGGELAYMTPETGGIEREKAVRPLQCFVVPSFKMPDAASGIVIPDLLLHIERQRQHLKLAALQRGQEVIDILPAQNVDHTMVADSLRTGFTDHTGLHPIAVSLPADRDRLRHRKQVRPRKGRCIRLHGEPMVGGGPLLVEGLVTAPATARPRVP